MMQDAKTGLFLFCWSWPVLHVSEYSFFPCQQMIPDFFLLTMNKDVPFVRLFQPRRSVRFSHQLVPVCFISKFCHISFCSGGRVVAGGGGLLILVIQVPTRSDCEDRACSAHTHTHTHRAHTHTHTHTPCTHTHTVHTHTKTF